MIWPGSGGNGGARGWIIAMMAQRIAARLAGLLERGRSLGNNSVDNCRLHSMMRSVPYFSTLSDRVFEDLMQSVQLRQMSAGQTIFLKGEGRGDAPFYLVVDGTVRIYLSSLHGREQVLRHFHAGDTFAEVPLFDDGPYPSSADALTDATLATIPHDQLHRLMASHPDLAVGVVKVMAGRLRHFNMLVEDLSLRRVISRVAHLLISEQSEELTQAQMAAMVGASREMVNRSLHSLADDDIIELSEGGRIIIRDAERLAVVVNLG